MANTMGQNGFNIDPLMKIGYVSLNVSDIQRSLEFYQSVLGFRILGKPSNDKALLTNDGNSSHLVELLRGGTGKTSSQITKRAGLYHFAILLPERKYLADILLSLREKRNKVHFDGLADHLVSEAIYIRDPDFNGIEIYRDRPVSEWNCNGSQIEMATLRLDTDNLLKEATKGGWKNMPLGTKIGHVHLRVRNLVKAMKFYHEILGLNLTTTYPGAYFFAADNYHHHIAANTWLGRGIEPASPDRLGLNHFAIKLSNEQEYEKVVKRFAQYKVDDQDNGSQGSSSVFVRDYDGITIRLFHT
ncbi:MAG: VOC family protein [Nitrososphaerales archaeon]